VCGKSLCNTLGIDLPGRRLIGVTQPRGSAGRRAKREGRRAGAAARSRGQAESFVDAFDLRRRWLTGILRADVAEAEPLHARRSLASRAADCHHAAPDPNSLTIPAIWFFILRIRFQYVIGVLRATAASWKLRFSDESTGKHEAIISPERRRVESAGSTGDFTVLKGSRAAVASPSNQSSVSADHDDAAHAGQDSFGDFRCGAVGIRSHGAHIDLAEDVGVASIRCLWPVKEVGVPKRG
jgi:hypothetical protein